MSPLLFGTRSQRLNKKISDVYANSVSEKVSHMFSNMLHCTTIVLPKTKGKLPLNAEHQ
jgi:hypothetical protein